MPFFATSLLVAFNVARVVVAQSNSGSALEPLASRHFTYPNLPYQVTGNNGGIRGPQSGYNICNSTTENQQSQCQTLILNSLDDFCMWSSNLDTPTDTIGEGEAREVAWCTKKGHGSRLIPAGAITGAQFLYAKNYVQVVGFIDQTKINLLASDLGGELDPHGADEQGNPLGGVVFTNAYSSNANAYAQAFAANSTPSTQYTQVIEWIDFVGNGVFCLKMCNPSGPNPAKLCEHVYDLIGCNYNALADYGSINGTYQVCDSDDMTPPGVFVTNGVTSTWFQPQTGAVVPPYTTSIPQSSNCHTFSSAQLYGGLPSSSSAAATATGTGAGAAKTSGASGSRSGTAAGASNTGTSAAPAQLTGTTALFAVAAITLTSMIVTLVA